MKTEEILKFFGSEIYFFILKKVKDKDISNDIFQTVFYKVHKYQNQVAESQKIKSWVFAIVRNEIANYYSKQNKFEELRNEKETANEEFFEQFCCLEKFIANLPEIYKKPMEMAFILGLSQSEISKELNISISNVKIRINRAKEILKKNFNECCKFELDKNGKLTGRSDCETCKNG